MDLRHLAGASGVAQAVAQQRQHFAISAAALAGVLIEHDRIKSVAEDACLIANVLVAPIARSADHDQAAFGRQGGDGLHQCDHRVRVVTIVGDHGRATVIHHVEAARGGRHTGHEAAQAGADGLPLDAGAPASGHRREHVFDLKTDAAAKGQRNIR